MGVKLSRLQKWERGASVPRFSIDELQRLNREHPWLVRALLTGHLPKAKGKPPKP